MSLSALLRNPFARSCLQASEVRIMAFKALLSKHVWLWLWLNDTNSFKDTRPRDETENDEQDSKNDRVQQNHGDEDEIEREDSKGYNKQNEESDEIEKLRSKISSMREELEILDVKLEKLKPRAPVLLTKESTSLPTM